MFQEINFDRGRQSKRRGKCKINLIESVTQFLKKETIYKSREQPKEIIKVTQKNMASVAQQIGRSPYFSIFN